MVGPKRQAYTAAAATCLGLFVGTVWIAAHEGHGTAAVKPVYQQVQAGDASYRIGFAMQPQDAVAAEDVRLEFQIIPTGGAPAPSGDLQVQILSTGAAPYTVPHVSPGDKPGTFLVRHRFEDSGQYRIAPRLQAGTATAGAEFPVLVSAGPVLQAPLVIDAMVLLIVGALIFGSYRRSQQAVSGASSGLGSIPALAGVGLVALVVGHMWLSPSVGRMFLPERHTGTIPWEATPPSTGTNGVEPHEHAPGTPPHDHDEQGVKAEEETAPHSHAPGTPPHTHKKPEPPPSSQR